jgi:chromosome segregation ATPase
MVLRSNIDAIIKINEELPRLKNQIELITNELIEENSKLELSRQTKEKVEKDTKDFMAQADTAKREKTQAESGKAVAEKDKTKLENESLALQKNNEALENAIKVTEARLKDLELRQKKSEADVSSAEVKARDTQSRLDDLNSKSQRAEAALATKNEDLASKRENVAIAESRFKQIESQSETLKADKDKIEQQIQQQKQEKSSLDRDVQQLRLDKKAAENEKAKAESDALGRAKEVQRLKDILDEQNAKISDAAKKSTELERKNAGLEGSLDSLTKAKETAIRELELKRTEIAEFVQRLNELKDQEKKILEKLTKELRTSTEAPSMSQSTPK